MVGPALAGLLGLFAGSFANVLIYRLPRGKSPNSPARSFCPACRTSLPWYDNIPLISYLRLRGRCRFCGRKIHWRYPVVEMSGALGLAALAARWGEVPLVWLGLSIFATMLLAAGWIDCQFKVLPDSLTLPPVLGGLLLAAWNPLLGDFSWRGRLVQAAIGATGTAAALGFLAWAGEKIFKREALGRGDVHLMMGVGAVLGPFGALKTLFLGSALGSLVGIFLIARKKISRRDYLAFGPFLCAAAYLATLI